jgi:hypothetical protein
LYRLDLTASWYLRGTPRFSLHDYYRHISPDKAPLSVSLNIPRRPFGDTVFKGLLESSQISRKMVTLLEEMGCFTDVLRSSRSNKAVMNKSDFTDKRCEIEARIRDVNRVPMISPTHVQECCRMAAAVHIKNVFRQIPLMSTVYNKLEMDLKALLLQTNVESLWEGYIEVLFWVAFMGGLAATMDRAWYISLIARICHALGITTWQESYQILEAFLWDDERCEAPGKVLWHMVVLQL